MSKEKIGLFFGTFDPIHNGHLRIAKYITEEKLADKVWLVVTPENPIKAGSKISSFGRKQILPMSWRITRKGFWAMSYAGWTRAWVVPKCPISMMWA